MAVGLLLVLVLGFLATAALVAILLRRRRFQYSLRTLLIVCALVAMGFSAWYSWQWWSLARVTWIDPASPEARQILSDPTIVDNGGVFQATFRPRHRGVQELLRVPRPEGPGQRGSMHISIRVPEQIDLESDSRAYLQQYLACFENADVPKPRTRVIHGRVEDAAGQPVARATVDLLGPYVYINHFLTRPDGTFSMPIEAPPQSGYRLRIRYGGEGKRMETPSFSLADDPAELMLIVRVR